MVRFAALFLLGGYAVAHVAASAVPARSNPAAELALDKRSGARGSCLSHRHRNTKPYTDPNGIDYNLMCNYDIVGNDISGGQYHSPDFNRCFPYCDDTAACNAFVYYNSVCYLKEGNWTVVKEPKTKAETDVAVKITS